MNFRKKIVIPILISSVLVTGVFAEDYTVRYGDSLYTISKAYATSIEEIKKLNNLSSDTIYAGQILKVKNDSLEYTVKSGDTLWLIAQRFGTSITSIKEINGFSNDTILVGQKIKIDTASRYTVVSGDTLWIISKKFGIDVQALKDANSLVSDAILVGQALLIPKSNTQSTTQTATQAKDNQASKQLLPLATKSYVVQAGDSISTVAVKFGMTTADLIKYNYLSINDWLNAGQTIYINGYAPRNYTVMPGEASEPARVGKLVDWYLEGQYIIKRGDVFTITDVLTGSKFRVKMIGGYNHIDIETISAEDTAIMYKTFSYKWQWAPRAVVIYKDGMNIAASLSGMPHSFDTISGNNMTGHTDLYLQNSKPHSDGVSTDYSEQHKQMVLKAAGQ